MLLLFANIYSDKAKKLLIKYYDHVLCLNDYKYEMTPHCYYLFLFGRLLLLEGFEKMKKKISLKDLQFNEYKKPYVENDIYFNISHSGVYVVCALSEYGDVGIDIEEKKLINIDVYKYCFTSKEWDYICESSNVIDSFYCLWTRKEAVLKADGRGLYINPKTFDVLGGSAIIGYQEWFLKRVDLLKEYYIHLAADVRLDDDMMHMIYF